jgi:acetylglutamate kinase
MRVSGALVRPSAGGSTGIATDQDGAHGGGSSRSWVVKVGGRQCEEPAGRNHLARACAELARPLVLVHGGGAQVSRRQRDLGCVPRFADGRRITATEDLEVVEMVLSGAVNKSLVRALARAGRPAVGLSGADGALLRCALVPGLGRVGTPTAVDARLLEAVLAAGFTPVVSPISCGPDGEAVNVNADEAAAALAAALGAERLLLLSDVDGVQCGPQTSPEVKADDVAALVASGQVTDGMIPKLRAAAAAVVAGVTEVRIARLAGDGASLADVQGTRVCASQDGGSR